MEDVLAVYSRAYDERFPVVCMDEKPVQFFEEARKKLSVRAQLESATKTTSTSEMAPAAFFFLQSLYEAGGMPTLRKGGEKRIGRNRLIGC